MPNLSEFKNEPLTDFNQPENRSAMEAALQKVKGQLGAEQPLVIDGRRITGLTDYMFDTSIPLWLRGVSLFHVPLPLVLIWMVAAWGYDRRALGGAVATALVTLPASYWLGSPEKNLNWVYGLGGRRQTRFPPLVYLAMLTAGFLVLVFLPTHWLLQWLFG